MNHPPTLTDRAALVSHRARAGNLAGHAEALFLHQQAMSDIQERLHEVNRTFTSVAVVTGFPDFWSQLRPDARIVRDDETLDLTSQAHDLVIHAMCLHWANDPVGQLIQCRRALRPDGLFIAVTPGGQSLNELRSSLAEAESRVSGGLSPRVVPMADIRELGALMQRSGFALPVADSLAQKVEYSSIGAVYADLRASGETNALAARSRRFSRRSCFALAEALYAEHFSAPSGRLVATVELVFLTGWAPHESQPQPLRPGAARKRLAEALGTDEKPLSDSG